MYYCCRCSKGTMEESAIIVCSHPFCPECVCADPQTIIAMAQEKLVVKKGN